MNLHRAGSPSLRRGRFAGPEPPWAALALVLLLALPAVPTAGARAPSAALSPIGTFASARSGPVPAHLGPYALVNGEHANVAALLPYYAARQSSLEGAMMAASKAPLEVARSPHPSDRSQVDRHPPGPFVPGAFSRILPLSPGFGALAGTIIDSRTGLPLANATVQLSELTSACGGVCNASVTGANGTFVLSGAPGPAILQVSGTDYLENDSLWTVAGGIRTVVGSIELEHDAYLTGTLLGSDPAHEPASNITVTGSDRSLTILGGGAVTNATGGFTVEVPPVPDELTYSPRIGSTGPYLGNSSFADPSPGATVQLGTIYLPHGTQLNVHLVDQTTGAQILNASPDIAACEADSAACPFVNSAVNGSIWALPGPTYLRVILLGYVQNSTDIGSVPAEPSGTVLNVTVDLVPDAVIVFSTNLTGGPPPAQAWNSSYGAVQFCSLSSLLSGFVDNATTGISGDLCSPILRSDPYQDFQPDQVLLAPPLRTEMHFFSHFVYGTAGYALPVFSNDSFLNTTPGQVVDLGVLDLTPGGWIAGRVVVQGTGSGPNGGFMVQSCSVEIAGACVTAAAGGTDCRGSTSDAAAFCVPTLPGAVQLTVLGPQITANRTWASSPFACCNPLGNGTMGIGLANRTRTHVLEINVTGVAPAYLHGRVLRGTSGGGIVPAVAAAIQICPVDPNAATNSCYSAIANSSGSFGTPVLAGWYRIDAALTGAGENRTWVDAIANNSTGSIVLQPFALAYGTAVTPSGAPIPGASVQVCSASEPNVCTPFGSGSTGTGGLFFGSHAGSPFPGGAYRFDVSEPGYSDGSVWGNLTIGSVVPLGAVVLVPTGTGAVVLGPHPASAIPPSRTTWVDGFAVDGRSGQPLLGYSVVACPLLSTAACLNFPNSPTQAGGEFNGSIPDGPTWINISQPGFEPASVFVNLSGTPANVGTIVLTPFPRVTGRVLLGPEENLTLVDGLSAAAAAVSVCGEISGTCGVPATPDTAGSFNVSAPPGVYDLLSIDPIPAATRDYTGTVGMSSYAGTISVPASGLALNSSPTQALVLTLDTELVGRVGDGSTWNAAAKVSIEPLRYALVTLTVAGATIAGGNTTGGGMYALLAPPGASVTIAASGPTARKVAASGIASPDSGTHTVPDLNAAHFGWVEVRLVSSGTGAGIAGAPVWATEADPANQTAITTSSQTDANGLANLSAPTGAAVMISAGGPGTGAASESVRVVGSATTVAPALRTSGGETTIWATSAEVNTVGVPPTVIVQDNATHTALPGAEAGFFDLYGQPTGAETLTNGLGQFLVASRPVLNGSFAVEDPGYSPNATIIPPSGMLRFAAIDLLGNGIVAGRVDEGTTGAPLDGVLVTGCGGTHTTVCATTLTNASGAYWLGLPPGLATFSFTAAGYVANQSFYISITPDVFLEAGPVALWASSLITGRVVGAPTGDPLPTARVTLCPIGQLFEAYCLVPIPVDPYGVFSLEAPGGLFVLNATAPGYAPISFEISTAPGEVVPLGDLYLVANGTLSGQVVASNTGGPLANVTVVACPVADPALCATNTTDAVGRYSVTLVPGACILSYTAANYEPASVDGLVAAAETLPVPVVTMSFLGPGATFPVTGSVGTGNGSGRPVVGAIVTAYGGGGEVASTATDRTGQFAIGLPWGSYTLTVAAPGYLLSSVPLVVHGPVQGVRTLLAPFVWPVGGLLTNVVTHAPVGGVLVELGGTALADSSATGTFTIGLANGSYTLALIPSAAVAGIYLPSSIAVAVAGVPVHLAPSIPVRTANVELVTVSSVTGGPVPGATIVLGGTLRLGSATNQTGSTDANGSLALTLPLGTFNLTASAPGYTSNSTSFVLNGGSLVLHVALGGGPASSSDLLVREGLPLTLAVAVVALVGAAVVIRRRRGPPEEPATDPEPGATPPPAGEGAPASPWDVVAERQRRREIEENGP